MPKEKDMIKKIDIYGGTHGNEWTGMHIVKHKKFLKEDIEIFMHESNAEAFKSNKRYLDVDLNRCFSPLDLENRGEKNREQQKALEIADQIKDSDFVIDLHTTTSDMGPTLIITKKDDLILRICKKAQEYYPKIKIILEYGDPYLVSLAKRGVIIEVGPCPQGVVKDIIFDQSVLCVEAVLSAVKDHNEGHEIGELETDVFEVFERVDYPRNEKQEIAAYLHNHIEEKCFKLLKIGEPLFKTFHGEVIHNVKYEGYPIFINEAAYYEKGVAFVLTRKRKA